MGRHVATRRAPSVGLLDGQATRRVRAPGTGRRYGSSVRVLKELTEQVLIDFEEYYDVDLVTSQGKARACAISWSNSRWRNVLTTLTTSKR